MNTRLILIVIIILMLSLVSFGAYQEYAMHNTTSEVECYTETLDSGAYELETCYRRDK